MKTLMLRFVFACIAAFASFGTATAAAMWTIEDLGTLAPIDINNHGDILGNYSAGRPFVRHNGVFTNLNPVSGNTQARAFAINDARQVAGDSQGTAVVWNGVNPTAIGNGLALAINNKGVVTGQVYDPIFFGEQAFFVYKDGVLTVPRNTPCSRSCQATGIEINDGGKVVTRHPGVAGSTYGYLYDIATGEFTTEDSVWYGEGLYGDIVKAIDEKGTMIGQRTITVVHNENDPNILARKPYNYSTNQVLDLPDPGEDRFAEGAALDINENGQIVGLEFLPNFSEGALLWNADGTFVELSDLTEVQAAGWTQLNTAVGINDRGIIIGTGRINGETHGYVLTPVPEPSTYAFMLFGLASAAFAIKKRRG